MLERFSSDSRLPAKRMREYVSVMRAVWAQNHGVDASFEGDFYQVIRPGPGGLAPASDQAAGGAPGVVVAAVSDPMIATAAATADGILGFPFTSLGDLEQRVLPNVERELHANRRERQGFRVGQSIVVSAAPDRATALSRAKEQVAWYGQRKLYAPVFASAGSEDLVDALTSAAPAPGDGMAERLISDDQAQRFVACGTPEEVQQQVSALAERVDDVILAPPWVGLDRHEQADAFAALVEVCAPARDAAGNPA
jgi:alkanesulfonate monooxygenase SsuD/methylene tetrahydromethanopterin reductase-like flavin-dependent oxidoreductase (luciferase family)